MMKKLTYFAFLLTFVISACALHVEQDVLPSVAVPEHYNGEAKEGDLIERWWESFHDPDLNALLDVAFKNNLDLKVTFARLEQMRATARISFSRQLPSVSAEYKTTTEKTPSFLGDNEGDSYSLSATASYEVDLWGKYYETTRAASFDFEAAEEDVLALYLSLSAQVSDLYYLALEQKEQINLTKKTIDSMEDTMQRVERRYYSGLISALDVYQAKENLAAARALLPVYEANLATAENELSALIGNYPDGDISGTVVELPTVVEAFPAGIPSELLSRRPDVRSAFLKVKASDTRIAAAIADFFPSINLIGTYGESSTVFSTGDIVGTFWKIVLDISAPLFDGGRRLAEVDRNSALFEERLASYQKSVLNAFRDVEDALVRNRATERRIAWLEERVKATESALRVSLDRYMQGLSDYLPVLTAYTSHFNAQSQLLAERRQLVSDRISLAKALGGKWMTDEYNRRLQNYEGDSS
jgi:NodT family efflux transporter outer membrane factor (OMF) lipoprotein